MPPIGRPASTSTYTRALIADKRRQPDGELVAELVAVEDEGDTLTEDEIVSTTMVLLEAGHEATVNTLGNGMRALMQHPDQWARLVDGAVEARTAIEEMLRWDPPRSCSTRWVLEPGSRSPGNRWRSAKRWPCSSARRSTTRGVSTIRTVRHRP